MNKKFLSLILALVLSFSLIPTAAAASEEATEAAETLYELGLFRGTGTNPDGTPIFDLDKPPTRNQAVIMLVRLLGKEQEALSGNWNLPFTDVPKDSTAYPYIGYAYANGLTNGTSATTYSGTNPIKSNQYIAFVLRSLGYTSGRDFQVGTSWKLANDIGLTNGEYDNNPASFTRGDVALISCQSLSCEKYVDIFANIPEETAAQKENFAKLNAAYARFNFPDNPGGRTLSWDESRALVGQDLDTVKRYVKTLDDCLYYICASGYTDSSGDLRYSDTSSIDGEISWHFNRSPQVVFEQNKGDCGGTAGLIAYLLEGDYAEVGIAVYRSYVDQGGHVVNYLKDGDLYYVFDPVSFAHSFSWGVGLRSDKDLNEAVKKMFGIAPYGKTYAAPAMMAYTYTGNFSRNGGDEPTGWPMEGNTYLPKTYIIQGYSEKVNIVHETPEEGYVYEFIEIDPRVMAKIEKLRNEA